MADTLTELDPAGLFTETTEAYPMSVPECLLRHQKRTIDAELVRCDRLLHNITGGAAGVRVRRKTAWPQVPYRWELRDSAQSSWTGSITLDEFEMKQVPGMADDVLRNVLVEKFQAARTAKNDPRAEH